ncbi:MAG: hypothetical protein INR69_15095 [Mucilaginibacter polytrichastri]|nr:hypothetical protein [Mucilaginibacter polytrichastri]
MRKFIQARYGCDVWEFNKSDRIGKIFYALLERVPRQLMKAEPYPKDFTARLRIEVRERYTQMKGVYLPQSAVIEFNDQIKLELVEEIAEYMIKLKRGVGVKKYDKVYLKARMSKDKKIRTIVATDVQVAQHFELRNIIRDVLDSYGITEDDFPFDTVKKNIQRLKIPLLLAG